LYVTPVRELEYRVAAEEDLADVLAVLDDAAGWLWRRRVHQWPERFLPEWVMPALRRGETTLALGNGVPVATFTLSWEDTAWPDAPDDAGYVHRLAVCRSAAGIGPILMEHIRGRVIERERSFVRLDCVASNATLCSYYERTGFRHCGDVEVRGAPGQRLIDGGDQVTVSRFELPLACPK
jgi:hypothetical protein